MRPDDPDVTYLWDILDAARSIREFTRGVRSHAYLKDRKLQMSVERGLEIIGEAARRLSPRFRNHHAEIPWKRIIRLRNILAHEYGEIKQERIWDVVKNHIPTLIEQVESLLPPAPRGPGV